MADRSRTRRQERFGDEHFSNVAISRELAERFARQLTDDVFDESPSGWAGAAIALETGGPDDGVGVCMFFYDARGQWKGVGVRGDEPMQILEEWVEDTYASVGSWTECLVQLLFNGSDVAAKFEFEFGDLNRWRYLTQGDALPDVLRPKGLPTPMRPKNAP